MHVLKPTYLDDLLYGKLDSALILPKFIATIFLTESSFQKILTLVVRLISYTSSGKLEKRIFR